MGYKNREIEKKFIVLDAKITFNQACAIVQDVLKIAMGRELFDAKDYDKNNSKDLYWASHNPAAADFIRLRRMPDGTGQLTLKRSDRGSNLNRIEIDVEVPDPEQTGKFLKQLFGKPLGSLHKDYFVLFIDENDTNVSVYKIRGNPLVFVEIEARTLSKVNKVTKLVSSAIRMKQERRSLYQLFFGRKK
jgi:adenylate cyclase class IV